MRNRWYPGRNRKVKVEWDFEDRLVKVTKSDGTVVENTYDVDGVLVRTSTNGVATDLLVDTSGGLSHVVAEIDGRGSVTAVYVRAGDMLLEEIRGGVAKMYEADGLGSTRSLLDTTGAQTDTWSYEAFGTTLSSTGTSVSPYRFAGERFMGDVGMYQNRARWLDTRTGLFVSVDPREPDEDEPATRHRYVYAAGCPTTFVDSSGLMFTVADVGIANSIAGVLNNAQANVGMAMADQIQYGANAGLKGLASTTIITVAASLIPGAVFMSARLLAKLGPVTQMVATRGLALRFVKAVVVVKNKGKVVAKMEGLTDLQPTFDRIVSGAAYPHKNDGSIFKNLPIKGKTTPELPVQPSGYYVEYVHPTPGYSPGPQRIVAGRQGELYYTPDHYDTFIKVN